MHHQFSLEAFSSSLPTTSKHIAQDYQAHACASTTMSTLSSQTSPAQIGGVNYDGRRMRNKTNVRKTVDYNASIVNWLHSRTFQRNHVDRRAIQPDPLYNTLMIPPTMLIDKPVNCLCTRSIRMAMNKVKCPIFTVKWTPEGRRLITGASSGEFTLWNGLTFNFETILQAHDLAVRSMVWSHSDQWMVTADHGGYVKYWQSNMNNVKMYQIHKEPVRGLSFNPGDQKFASCSDDSTVRIWDFFRCYEEKIFRGHGADVRCVDWHPEMSVVASGSRDTQQPVKLWDVKSGSCLSTIHAHKHTVMDLKWNKNGNWLLTASRDHLLKLFDIRNIKEEVQQFRGHKKEATTIAWHPVHESLFASGGSDGSIMYWIVGNEKGLGGIENAHDTMVWSLDWHPLGHIIASGSNDHTTKFWTRNRPGDLMRDRYNLNTLPYGADENDADVDVSGLPGLENDTEVNINSSSLMIPGLDVAIEEPVKVGDCIQINNSFPGSSLPSITLPNLSNKKITRKPLHNKSVPREFERAWKEGRQPSTMMNQPHRQESEFLQTEREVAMEVEEIPEETRFRQNIFHQAHDVDGSRDEYSDENQFLNDDFHDSYGRSSNYSSRSGQVEYSIEENFNHLDHIAHSANGDWSRGSRGSGNYIYSRRHYLKPSISGFKRKCEDLGSLEIQSVKHSHLDFGDDFVRRDASTSRNRGRGNRAIIRGYSYR